MARSKHTAPGNGFKTVTCEKCGDSISKRKTLGRTKEVKHKDEKTGKVRKTWTPVRICRSHLPKAEQKASMASPFIGRYNKNPLTGAGTLGG